MKLEVTSTVKFKMGKEQQAFYSNFPETFTKVMGEMMGEDLKSNGIDVEILDSRVSDEVEFNFEPEPMPTKRVFSKEVYMEDMSKVMCPPWADKCDGKTEDEMNKMGFDTADAWMIDVPIPVEHTSTYKPSYEEKIEELEDELRVVRKHNIRLLDQKEALDYIIREQEEEYSELEHDYEVLSKEYRKMRQGVEAIKSEAKYL